jgi:hypothetical protein
MDALCELITPLIGLIDELKIGVVNWISPAARYSEYLSRIE